MIKELNIGLICLLMCALHRFDSAKLLRWKSEIKSVDNRLQTVYIPLILD